MCIRDSLRAVDIDAVPSATPASDWLVLPELSPRVVDGRPVAAARAQPPRNPDSPPHLGGGKDEESRERRADDVEPARRDSARRARGACRLQAAGIVEQR